MFDKSVEWITFPLIQIHIGISHKGKIYSEISTYFRIQHGCHCGNIGNIKFN